MPNWKLDTFLNKNKMNEILKLSGTNIDNLFVIKMERLSGMYLVDKNGNVYSKKCKNGQLRKVKQYISPNGYVKVNLTHNGKNINLLCHRIVALTFLDNTENKSTVNHIDGNKLNNSLNNLEWATILENARHARATGLIVGIKHSEETKKRMSMIQKNIGSGGRNARKVINNLTNEVFENAKIAANKLKLNYSHFCESLNNKVTNHTNCIYL